MTDKELREHNKVMLIALTPLLIIGGLSLLIIILAIIL